MSLKRGGIFIAIRRLPASDYLNPLGVFTVFETLKQQVLLITIIKICIG